MTDQAGTYEALEGVNVAPDELVLSEGRSYDGASREKTYAVPEDAIDAARDALHWKDTGHDGMTDLGIRRTLQLARGYKLSQAELEDIADWFARHAHYKEHHEIEDGVPTASLVSWKGWGGDAMREFAEAHTDDRENRQSEAQRFLSLVEMYVQALEEGRVDESMTDDIEAVMYEVAEEVGVNRSKVQKTLEGKDNEESRLPPTPPSLEEVRAKVEEFPPDQGEARRQLKKLVYHVEHRRLEGQAIGSIRADVDHALRQAADELEADLEAIIQEARRNYRAPEGYGDVPPEDARWPYFWVALEMSREQWPPEPRRGDDYSDTQMDEEVESGAFGLPVRTAFDRWLVADFKQRAGDLGLNSKMYRTPRGWDPSGAYQSLVESLRTDLEKGIRGDRRVSPKPDAVAEATEESVFQPIVGEVRFLNWILDNPEPYQENTSPERGFETLQESRELPRGATSKMSFARKLMYEEHGVTLGKTTFGGGYNQTPPYADRADYEVDIPRFSDVWSDDSDIGFAEALSRRNEYELAIERAKKKSEEDRTQAFVDGLTERVWPFFSWYVGNGWSTTHLATLRKKWKSFYSDEDDSPQLRRDSVSESIVVEGGGAGLRYIAPFEGDDPSKEVQSLVFYIAHLRRRLAIQKDIDHGEKISLTRKAKDDAQEDIESGEDPEELYEAVEELIIDAQLQDQSMPEGIADVAPETARNTNSGRAEQDVDAWLRSIDEEHRQTAAKRVIDGNEGALTKHHDADTALWAINEAGERGFISTETEEALREAVTSDVADGDDPTSIDVQDVPLDEVHTDEDRFQPRGGDFSEETARRVAEDYDPSLMDPIDLWRDPDDRKLYVLAGHSRLEGFRRRDVDSIPAVVKEDMTEEQAIRYALVENDKGTNLTNAERAGVVRRMRESGELGTMKEQREFAQDLYDRNASVVFDLSWLDPKGKATDVLTRLEGSQSADYRDAETMAQWVGKMMRLHRDDFTRQHENEMFDFLIDNYKTEGRAFTSFPEFRNYVEEAKNRAGPLGSFGEDDRLNLEQVRPQSQQERQIDRQVQEAKEELRDAKRELDERRSELLERMQREEGVTREDVQRALDPLEERVQAAQQDLITAKEEADRARSEVQQSQMSLMDAVRENPEPLVYLGRCRQLTTREGASYRGGDDVMFTTPNMDALIIVPVDKVERHEDLVDDDAAEDAYEEWHHFEADETDFRFRLDNFDQAERVGTAERIRYWSDKVMRPGDEEGEEHAYYHDFDDTHGVYEVPQAERLALLVGAQAEGETIEPEGTLEIDGRGILN